MRACNRKRRGRAGCRGDACVAPAFCRTSAANHVPDFFLWPPPPYRGKRARQSGKHLFTTRKVGAGDDTNVDTLPRWRAGYRKSLNAASRPGFLALSTPEVGTDSVRIKIHICTMTRGRARGGGKSEAGHPRRVTPAFPAKPCRARWPLAPFSQRYGSCSAPPGTARACPSKVASASKTPPE